MNNKPDTPDFAHRVENPERGFPKPTLGKSLIAGLWIVLGTLAITQWLEYQERQAAGLTKPAHDLNTEIQRTTATEVCALPEAFAMKIRKITELQEVLMNAAIEAGTWRGSGYVTELRSGIASATEVVQKINSLSMQALSEPGKYCPKK